MSDQQQPIPYGGYPGQNDPVAPEVPAAQSTNRLAIASLITAVLGGGLISAVLGLVALSQIRRRDQKGRGLAIAGLVLSGLGMLFTVAVVVLAHTRPATTVVADPDVDRALQGGRLAPGDCIGSVGASARPEDLPVVPCSEPHGGEVYTVFTLPDRPYPGEAAVAQEAETRCDRSFQPYAKDGTESLELYYLSPSSMSWLIDRGVTCIAVDPAGTRTGSLVD